MKGYEERMVEELDQLKERCNKLEEFLESETYDKMSDADQCLLLAQIQSMVGYYTFLDERVQRIE